MPSIDQEVLTKTIEAVRVKINKFKDRAMFEQQTKASLIEPVLSALGWDVQDPDEVQHEYKVLKKDAVDYALKVNRNPRLFVEAKGLAENLDHYAWIKQVLGYTTMVGVPWCVLTNGDRYKIYNATAKVDAESKLFHDVSISTHDLKTVVSVLTLISRPNMADNILDIAWESHFVDRQVKKSLVQLFNGPDSALVKLLKKHLPMCSPKQIASSIRRLEVNFEIPTILKNSPVEAQSAKSKSTNAPKKNVKKQFYSVQVYDLIKAKQLEPPVSLFSTYLKTPLAAHITPSGKIRFDNVEYDSLSAAASMAKKKVGGKYKATDGWLFWKLTNSNGDTCRLKDVRDKYLKSKSK